MNKLTLKLCAMVRVFVERLRSEFENKQKLSRRSSSCIRSEKETTLDFIRYQKVENSLRINLHFTAYMFNGLLVSLRKVQK